MLNIFINTNMFFSKEIRQNFNYCKALGVKFFKIGKSVLGKPILACHIGSYFGRQIIIQGAIHAREYITALLIFEQILYLAKKLKQNKNYLNGGVYFVPIANPDGVDICINNLKNIKCVSLKQSLKNINGNKNNFSLFKANANGVDLNTNFDAAWGTGSQNKNIAASENYIGPSPSSEPETKALIYLTKLILPDLTISYHSKGEVIYYGFKNKNSGKFLSLAKLAQKITGYEILESLNSSGGFKDWCIDKLNIPSLTIEIGSDKLTHPITKKNLPKIIRQNLFLPEVLLNTKL